MALGAELLTEAHGSGSHRLGPFKLLITDLAASSMLGPVRLKPSHRAKRGMLSLRSIQLFPFKHSRNCSLSTSRGYSEMLRPRSDMSPPSSSRIPRLIAA
jgi:hypothetical protein